MKISYSSIMAKMIDVAAVPAVLLMAPLAAGIARLRNRAPLSRGILVPGALHAERALIGLNLNQAGQFKLLKEFKYRDELLAIPPEKASPATFGYRNESFPVGDAEYLYNMIRHFKPRRIVEVGSGNSTLMARLAIAKNESEDPQYTCEHICIEPYEQPWLEEIGVTVIRERVELCSPEVVSALAADDILFIDSSHVIRPQGDVVHIYLGLLSRLQQGVVVHAHDIFTPRDYLANWVLNERRMWNEQYLLEAFLSFNPAFEIIGAVNWLARNHMEKLNDACPLLVQHGGSPGSFWFRRILPPLH